MYSIFGREITKYTVEYGVYIRCIYGIFGRVTTKYTVIYKCICGHL